MINVVFGIISGFLCSMGIGGGTILIICLITFLGIDQHIAQGINLFFFIPTCLVSIFLNIKNKNIHKSTFYLVAISGIIGAVIGAKISIYIDVSVLRKIFGYFLLIIAIFELFSLIKLYKKDNNS